MLPFLAIAASQRFEVFLAVGEKAKWRWSTREMYFTALLAAMQALEISPTLADKRNLKWLKAQTMKEIPNAATPMTVQQACCLPDDFVSWAIQLGFFLGQRLSDIVLLHSQRITIAGPFLALTLVEGKVIPKIGPFTLFLPLRCWLSQRILSMKTRREVGYLFPTETLQVAAFRLHSMGLENRSVRRGGLQAMALQGWPISTLLQFSRHRDQPMLMKYLEHGRVVLSEAHTMAAVFQSIAFPTR